MDVTEIDRILSANAAYAAGHSSVQGPRPARALAVVTCMDVRIDVSPVLGLSPGDAHVIRNAGARVTPDVLRSLAVSGHVLGVDTVVVMPHTRCGLAGATNEELQALTGCDLDFLTIDDPDTTLRDDVAALSNAAYLNTLKVIAGFIYDVDTGLVREVARLDRHNP